MKSTCSKQVWYTLLLSAICISGYGQTRQNFNSRQGITLQQVKADLQTSCWTISDFDVNKNGWNPGLEGNGALVSGNGASEHSSIGSPALKVGENFRVSFSYKFNHTLGNGIRRWARIYLADFSNQPVLLLDSIEFKEVNGQEVYKYSGSFTGIQPGAYKVVIAYEGKGGSTNIAIDQLEFSAPLYYAMGCNQAPIATNDIITGLANRTATGNILGNDSDADNEQFEPYILTNSTDGTVTLQADKTIRFTPTQGFEGNTTSFTYTICDKGADNLCSVPASVTINFPASTTLPVRLVDLTGLYNGNGRVAISWTTSYENNSDRFEVERSFDGVKWNLAGMVKAKGNSSTREYYKLDDELSKNVVLKRDIYYRLKQFDADGETTISRILVVRVYNTAAVTMVAVTPNPARNDISVQMQLQSEGMASIRVFNGAGKEVTRKITRVSAGNTAVMIEGSNRFAPGFYMLEVIINSKERMLVKMIKE